MDRPPPPPFTAETAAQKARAVDAQNLRDRVRVAAAHSIASRWRNDLPITENERKYHWPLGRRPDGHPGLSDLGL